MAPKRVTRKRPAAGADEPFGSLRPGFLLDDLSALRQRADLAAKEAAARYTTPNGVSIVCICIGQPRIEGESSPYTEDCGPNANRWTLPERATHICLAFRWEIFEGGAFVALCPLPFALCPLPVALCPLPVARRPVFRQYPPCRGPELEGQRKKEWKRTCAEIPRAAMFFLTRQGGTTSLRRRNARSTASPNGGFRARHGPAAGRLRGGAR